MVAVAAVQFKGHKPQIQLDKTQNDKHQKLSLQYLFIQHIQK